MECRSAHERTISVAGAANIAELWQRIEAWSSEYKNALVAEAQV